MSVRSIVAVYRVGLLELGHGRSGVGLIFAIREYVAVNFGEWGLVGVWSDSLGFNDRGVSIGSPGGWAGIVIPINRVCGSVPGL